MVVWHTDHLLHHYNYTAATGALRSMRLSGANNENYQLGEIHESIPRRYHQYGSLREVFCAYDAECYRCSTLAESDLTTKQDKYPKLGKADWFTYICI